MFLLGLTVSLSTDTLANVTALCVCLMCVHGSEVCEEMITLNKCTDTFSSNCPI